MNVKIVDSWEVKQLEDRIQRGNLVGVHEERLEVGEAHSLSKIVIAFNDVARQIKRIETAKVREDEWESRQ